MFWKYLFPLFLCFFLAWFIRKFLCTITVLGRKERRIPRIWIIFIMLGGFIPIVNYVVAVLVITFVIISSGMGDLEMRKEPFKNKKLQNWLLKK